MKYIYKKSDAPILKGLHFLNQSDVDFYNRNIEQWTISNIVLIYLKNFDHWLGTKIKMNSSVKEGKQ